MTIDCTLDSFKFPALPTYGNQFGTKKAAGGLSTAECCDDVAMPFLRQRPFVVTETSQTSEIQSSCVFNITTAGISLVLADAAYDGCTCVVINTSAGNVTVAGGVSGLNGGTAALSFPANSILQFIFFRGWRTLIGASATGAARVPVAPTLADHAARKVEVDGEKTARENAVTAESNARATADAAEKTARENAVAAVQTNLETHAGAASVHGATSAATAGRIVVRDGSGNAYFNKVFGAVWN